MVCEEDINDVSAMGGVDLAEESRKLGATELIGKRQIRSCHEAPHVSPTAALTRAAAAAARAGLAAPPATVAALAATATVERIISLLALLAGVARHRSAARCKKDSIYEVSRDVRQQLHFLAELERRDRQRCDESEREALMRAAASRSRSEDDELVRLRAKAKEVRRSELEALRLRNANRTALRASHRGGGGGATYHKMALRSRLSRVNQRDVLHVLERERDSARSLALYRTYLK